MPQRNTRIGAKIKAEERGEIYKQEQSILCGSILGNSSFTPLASLGLHNDFAVASNVLCAEAAFCILGFINNFKFMVGFYSLSVGKTQKLGK